VGKSYTYTGKKSKRTCNCLIVGWVDARKPNIIKTFVGLRYRLTQPTLILILDQFWFFIMIELVSESWCIQCNLCVKVCPTNVFDQVPDAPPTIARQSDCQTCFMCELYCPVDALYVSPDVEPLTGINEQSLAEAELLGSYRKNIGWGKSLTTTAKQDSTYQLLNKMK
jgi:ferredoxin